jgi:hypothetical protein
MVSSSNPTAENPHRIAYPDRRVVARPALLAPARSRNPSCAMGSPKIISLAGVREAMKSGHGGGIEVVWLGHKNKNGQLGASS